MERPVVSANTTDAIKNEALLALLIQLVEANRGDLANRYHQSLRATLFTNRSDVHPALLRRIAAEEVDALLQFLHSPSSTNLERGIQLCQTGLSEKSLLQLSRATRQFFSTHLENNGILPALDVIETYHDALIQGFIQSREKIVLNEQERIRRAFELTISRFTIQIKEVQELAQRATEANEFKSRFIARISHEVRTPLGAMLGMSEMLQQSVYGSLTPAQEDIIQRIINNVRSLERIFSELLDQTRIETGQLSLKEVEFSPQILAHTVYSNYLPLALQKGLAMHLHVDSDLPSTLVGDNKRIEQILNNLVINAIKYTETGGIDIYVDKYDISHWVMRITDTGVGISKEAQEYIFQPFRQVDESMERKQGGVGLGLAIVKELVTIMQGTVGLDSKVGQGSTFTVILPYRT